MAVLKVHNGTAWDIAIGKVFDGTVWKEKMKFNDGSAFVDLFGVPLALEILPDPVFDTGSSPLTTANIAAVATGGSGGNTYVWSWLTGGVGITINSPTSVLTTLTATGSVERSGSLQCIVTDSDTNTASDFVSVTLAII